MIRYATRGDIPVIAHMLRLLHDEAPAYSDVPIDEAHVLRRLEHMIQDDNSVVLFYSEGRGFILGSIGSTFWDSRPILCEQLLYVLPIWRRNSTLVRDLVKEFEDVGKYNKCHRIVVGSSTGIRTEIVVKMYERFGYSRAGTSLWKDIKYV